MEVLIAEAKLAYKQAGLDCGHALLPAADNLTIDRIAEVLCLPLPPELRALYSVHGGQRYVSPGVTGLFGQHRLHSPHETVECHRMFAENCLLDPLPSFPPAVGENGYWVSDLIPFASWDAYYLCAHAHSGEVWEFNPHSGLANHRHNIASVLREVIEAVRAGKPAQLDWTRGQ